MKVKDIIEPIFLQKGKSGGDKTSEPNHTSRCLEGISRTFSSRRGSGTSSGASCSAGLGTTGSSADGAGGRLLEDTVAEVTLVHAASG